MGPSKKPGEDVSFARTLQAAKSLYTMEMDKIMAMGGTKTISLDQLQENHSRVITITLEQIKGQVPNLSSNDEKILRTTFEDLFKKIVDNNAANKVNSPAIGIDLGTTYSCVAIYQDGKVTIIPNELGARTTPSYVAFDDSGNILIGDPAKHHTNINPDERIYDVKRLIGRSYDDPVVQEDIKLWPFQVVSDDNTPKIKVRGRTFYPEQISAKILASLKKQAEEYLGHPVSNAVITVPAYFNDGQRQATKDAGTIAGLNVLRIINEPTAAAIAYSHQLDPKSQKNILVFDLGGGTFDVVILTMDRGYIQIKSVGGDTHLGGEDFDNSMVDHCIREFKTKKGIDLAQAKNSNDLEIKSKAARCLRRLKNECEQQKRNLSAARVVPVSLEAIYNDIDLSVRFSRDIFNNLNLQTFQKCVVILEQVLKDAGLQKNEIDDVVLVGGSSRIPKIREMIEQFFDGKQLCKAINPDEAVAHGAALQAALMTYTEGETERDDDTWHVTISDVIPLPVGIKIFVEEGRTDDFSVILGKNTNVPCENKKRFYTIEDGQKEVEICIYEGVHDSVDKNHLLGSFLLQNLPSNSIKGEPIDVKLEINSEGILHVTAECPASRAVSKIVVDEFKKRLKPEDVATIYMEELFLSLASNVPV